MKTEDVLALAKAGFTAAQISALAQTMTAPEQPKPETKPVAKPEPAPSVPGVEDVLAKLGVLTDAIQANGISSSRQPQPETTDDILAAIIAPPSRKE